MSTGLVARGQQNGAAALGGEPLAPEILEKVIVEGDLKNLTANQRVAYYKARCDAIGINPIAKPFDYLVLNNKTVLYANKSCSDQLAMINHLDAQITKVERDDEKGVYIASCTVTFPTGRKCDDVGVVSIKGLAGDALCNAIMKAITKAKRRTILSACGLGATDESELETIPDQCPASQAPLRGPAAFSAAMGRKGGGKAIDAPTSPVATEEPAPESQPEWWELAGYNLWVERLVQQFNDQWLAANEEVGIDLATVKSFLPGNQENHIASIVCLTMSVPKEERYRDDGAKNKDGTPKLDGGKTIRAAREAFEADKATVHARTVKHLADSLDKAIAELKTQDEPGSNG